MLEYLKAYYTTARNLLKHRNYVAFELSKSECLSENFDSHDNWNGGIDYFTEPTWRWDGGFVIVTFKRPTKNVAPQETIKSSGDENSIQTGYYAKEAKENPKEIIDAINNRGLTDVQCNLLSLIITMPSITLSKMAEELDLTIDQVRTLRKKMENKGVFLCRKGATKKGTWEIKFE